MLQKAGVYKAIFYFIIIVQTLIVIGLPLIQIMNDSAWYYMNVHYLNTGEYVNESMYPSFHKPSQYYPVLGYSAFLFICNKIATTLGIGVALLIKFSQHILYILSALMVQRIVHAISKRQVLSYIIGIIFLLSYTDFNYVVLVASETYATFLVLLSVYLYVKAEKKNNIIVSLLMFLVSGYMILVKPVFLPVSIMIAVLYTIQMMKSKQYFYLVGLLALFLAPVSQALFSKAYYDNYKLQSGLGWHLWDRVIGYDKLIPNNSNHLEKLTSIYKENYRTLTCGYWWDVTKDLSNFGYSESEADNICKRIAMDGIQEYPVRFVGNTMMNCYNNFLQHNEPTVYKTLAEYHQLVNDFSFEPQHKPLTNELLQKSNFMEFSYTKTFLEFNYYFSLFVYGFNVVFHNSLIFWLFVLAGIHCLYVLCKNRLNKGRVEFLIWFTAFAILFGSNIAEYPQPRLFQPAVIFVVIIITVKLNEVILRRKKQNA